MAEMSTPTRRSRGDLDVYTVLLGVAFLVLAAGVAILALNNIEHSKVGNDEGGALKIVDNR